MSFRITLSLPQLILLIMAMIGWASFSIAAEPVRIIHESVEDCPNPDERAAVIFIHGIIGSKATWTANSGEEFWPTMLATDPSIGNQLDVYRVDYDSFLFEEGPSIVDVLESLQKQLDEILLVKQYSTVFLIGHSLGGNIARAYLMHVKARFGHRALSAFTLTFTLGTPVLGSELATIGRLASSNQQLRVLLPIKVNDFGQLLNLTLRDIVNKHQDVYCPRLYSFAAFENLPLPLIGIVVSKSSASSSADQVKGFDRTHISLAKPNSRDDDVYTWVQRSISSCLKPTNYAKHDFEGACKFPLLLCGSTPEGWPNSKFELVPRMQPGVSTPLPGVRNP